MHARRARSAEVGYPVLVALLVAATLAAGSVLYQLAELGGHGHGGGGLAVAVDTAGFAMAFLLGAQLMTGYGLIRLPRPRFRRVHAAMAWWLVALLAFHGAGGALHSLEPPVETLPLVLDAVGIVLAALLAVQLSSGYRSSRPKATRTRTLHAAVAVALAIAVAGHAVLGIVHTVLG
jgi:hypothetical protein